MKFWTWPQQRSPRRAIWAPAPKTSPTVSGIRRRTLYYYFPSKEAALAAICEFGVNDFIAHLRDILASPLSSAEKLHAAVADHLMPLRTRPQADYIRVFIRHRHELPDGPRHAVAALARDYQSLIERMFVEGIASGEFRSSLNPQLATLALLGLCNSVIAARTCPPPSALTTSSTSTADRHRRDTRTLPRARVTLNTAMIGGEERHQTWNPTSVYESCTARPTSTGSLPSSSGRFSALPVRLRKPRPMPATSGGTSTAAF